MKKSTSKNTENEKKEQLNNPKTINKKLKVKSKRHRIPQHKATRYTPDVKNGLSSNIVENRIVNGLTNATNKKYTKSTFSIIVSNCFTFFNLLGLIVFLIVI